MEESRALRRAGWAGAASVVLLIAGLTLCAMAGVEKPGVSDAEILERLGDGTRQTAAGIGLPVLGAGLALLLWFAGGLRRVLDRLSGGDPLAHAIVPAAALLGGLMIAGVSLDVSSAITAKSGRVHPRPGHRPRARHGGGLVALSGLTGGAVLVAVTTRIAQQARALPTWAVWVSYAVAVLCLSGFWSGGMASVALLAVARRRRRRGAARGATDTAGVDRPGAGRTGCADGPHSPDRQQRLTLRPLLAQPTSFRGGERSQQDRDRDREVRAVRRRARWWGVAGTRFDEPGRRRDGRRPAPGVVRRPPPAWPAHGLATSRRTRGSSAVPDGGWLPLGTSADTTACVLGT